MTANAGDHEEGTRDRVAGRDAALESLLPTVYEELRRLARQLLRSQRPGHTLQPTALVHEAYLRLRRSGGATDDRRRFYCVAARAMRQILINHARDRRRMKRGGERRREPFERAVDLGAEPEPDLLALDEALRRLQEIDERKGRIVELRYFAGLSVEEIARLLEISTASVKRDWAFSKAWLLRRIGEAKSGGE